MWVPTKSNVLGRFKIYPKSLYACMVYIGIFSKTEKKRNSTTTTKKYRDTIYTPHGVVLFGCYLHFIHSTQYHEKIV